MQVDAVLQALGIGIFAQEFDDEPTLDASLFGAQEMRF
jgi:hypothetical protein